MSTFFFMFVQSSLLRRVRLHFRRKNYNLALLHIFSLIFNHKSILDFIKEIYQKTIIYTKHIRLFADICHTTNATLDKGYKVLLEYVDKLIV